MSSPTSAPAAGGPTVEVQVVPQEMALLSNLLAAYTFIADQPERTALVFLGGVCAGLVVTLCAIVFQIHCRADCHYGNSQRPHHRHRSRAHRHLHHHSHHSHHTHQPHHQEQGHQRGRLHSSSCPVHPDSSGGNNPPTSSSTALVLHGSQRAPGPSGDSESEDWDDTSDLSARRRRRFERALLHAGMFTSAEELDRAQRLEERERILREIWMNGQPDISTVTQSLNRYY